MRGPHNIIRLVRTLATLERTGAIGVVLVSQGSGAQLKLMTQPAPIPVAGATQSATGALVVAGSRGARTLAIVPALEP